MGLALADFATGAQQLLVSGRYESPAWSPEGARFAALGVATPQTQTQQLAIFAADGRALARYPIPLTQRLSGLLAWSPDSRALLYRFTDSLTGRPLAWIVDETGQRSLDLGPGATPWGWTPDSRFAYFVREGGNGASNPESIVAVWTMTAAGGDPRREAAGPFLPLEWSTSGTDLYVSSGLRAYPAATGQSIFLPTTLVAIDVASGVRRTLVDLGMPGGAMWLGGVAIAPDGGPIAVVRRKTIGGTWTPNDPSDLWIVDEGGRGIAQTSPWSELSGPNWLVWSPDGRHLSYDAPGPDGHEVRILAPFADKEVAYPATIMAERVPGLAWSPDGRWIAYTDRNTLRLALGETTQERSYQITADGNFPAWQPEGR